ncbi:uncharacterized protein LOC113367290 [Ctenocephalides felis]|uniref:uncharacterized protein LOC113367290 n=1 Tax=Ctenocephalides felis TaxID=7515 RepID=UPI000E6E55CA|nr:uncharacterized protein LOC113367290 [Ctenocephalides felis]
MCSNIMDNQLLDNSKCCSEQNLMMTFKSRAPLELHTRHMVIVSAIDEETLTCCVQLLSLQTNLEQLMIQINNCKKYHFDEIPINGSTCIGQFKNGLYYRATVMGVGDINSLKLYSIDYGTTEMVSFAKVFQIDAEFILDKLQKCFMSQHQSKRFKDNLPSVMQQVAVSWFVNPHNFHCQLKCNDAKLVDLMKNIQTKYSKIKSNAFNAEVEDAVIVKYKQDNIMYRGRIVNIKEQRYLIQFVDYGFKDIVGPTDIFPIEDEFLLEPTFAIKCKINSIIPIRMDKSNLPQIYGFFKQNVYDCMFNETDANGYTNVELSHNGADVGLQLVENGFAIFASEDIRNDIEFDLLRGQFIKGKILGVKSFQIFFVNLFQTDSQFECGLYKWNCDENDPEYNKMRKSFCEMTENNTFIIYINEIQGTKLFVTLYDSSGCKVVPFSSDESISSVFPLCAKPVYRQNMNVIISHRNGDQAFIQEDSDMTLLSELLDNLFQFYENNGDMPQTELTEGNVCAAKSLLDSNWYRAIIIQSRENDYLVRYVDYGNEELLPFNNIKELSTAYYELYMLCLEVIASNDFCHDASDDLIKVNLSRKGKMWYLTSGHKLCNNEQSHPAPEISSKSNNVGHKDSIQTELTQTCDLVIVAHIDSPSQFWVQDASNKEALLHLQEVLQNIAEKLPSLTNLQVGRICVAKYSIDDLWYRAVILDADSDITTIRFIDFGNTDVIENSDNLLKDLDGELKQIEPLATKCSLLAASVEGDDWSENACKEFEEFVNFLKLSNKMNGHGITCDVSDIHDTSVLCSDSDVLTQKKTGYISHFVDLNEFYVQLECDRAGLEFLEDALSNAASFPVCKNPVKDVVCVAQFADDMLWYRASILNVLPDCYEVFFIDFGNTGTTKEIRDMPASLDNIGQLAKQCYIFIPDDLSSLSFEIGQKLQEISGDGLTIFDIEFMSLCSPS